MMLFSASDDAPSSSADVLKSTVEMLSHLLVVVQAVPLDRAQRSREVREEVGEVMCACAAISSCAIVTVDLLTTQKELANLVEALIVMGTRGLGGLPLAAALADLLSAINTHSLEFRLPELGHSLFDTCVQYLLPCAMYPRDFVDWNSSELDEVEFRQFRQHDFVDLLQQAYALNGFRCAIYLLCCFCAQGPPVCCICKSLVVLQRCVHNGMCPLEQLLIV
jgi:hypothetical protein